MEVRHFGFYLTPSGPITWNRIIQERNNVSASAQALAEAVPARTQEEDYKDWDMNLANPYDIAEIVENEEETFGEEITAMEEEDADVEIEAAWHHEKKGNELLVLLLAAGMMGRRRHPMPWPIPMPRRGRR